MKKLPQRKVVVSERALVKRLNRSLAAEGQMIRKSRRPDTDTGEYFCIDVRRNSIEAAHVDLEKWGREAGVLRGWEAVADAR